MHILLISQYFHPETFRVNDIASEWVRRGHKVTVLTGIPNYPMGKFYDGYGYHERRRESWQGVDIIRIPLIPRGNSRNKLFNAIGMTANYLSFVRSGKKWVRSQEARELKPDIVFTVEVSPMTQALIGCEYRNLYRVPHYLYVQDLWPENVETVTGIHSPVVINPIVRMVKKIYDNTDRVFTTSPSFVTAIVDRDIPESKVFFWPQYAEEFYRPMKQNDASESVTKLIPDDGRVKIAFTGNIGTAQGLDILPKVAELLKDDDSVVKVRFVIVGDGRFQETLENEIMDRGVSDMFTFVPRQPAENIPGILACCDMAFLSFQNEKLWEMTIPAKLQSYMACGMPIVAAAGGETKKVIEEAGSGVSTPTGDEYALKEAIVGIVQQNLKALGDNSKAYAREHFNKTLLMDQMDVWLEEGISRSLSDK